MNDSPARPLPPLAPDAQSRWLKIAAGLVLVLVLGATALSIGVWLNEGKPAVAASFGGFGRGGGFNGPPGGGQLNPGGGAGQQPGQTVPGQGQGQFTPPQGRAPGQQQGQGTTPPQRPGAQPNQGPATMPPGLSAVPDINGVVTSTDSHVITIQGRTGRQAITLLPDTQVVLADGSSASLSDLRNGSTVAIVLVQGAPVLTASEILIVR